MPKTPVSDKAATRPKSKTVKSRIAKTQSPNEAAPARKRSSVALRSATQKLRHKKALEEESIQRSENGQRILQVPKRIWYMPLTWGNRPPVPEYEPLPKARKLFLAVLKLLWANKKVFAYIVVIYGVLDILLVRGVSGSSNLSSLKNSLNGAEHGVWGKLAVSSTSFTYLLASSGSNASATSGVYQVILLIVCSLAVIWTLRQSVAGYAVRVRDGFYQGMYPLIPFILIFLLICLQLLPFAIGGGLLSVVTSTGITAHWWEQGLWIAFFILMALWSLRMVTASLFAIYIVTLPDMTPLRAYRSARQLVYGRRLLIWRKLIFLPVVLLLIAGIIEVPLILFLTPMAVWAFFLISMLALPIVHGYLYNLYRDML